MQKESAELTVAGGDLAVTKHGIPSMIASEGTAAMYSWDEFFAATIRNRHTRKAYLHAVRLFLDWCESQSLTLPEITPGMVGRYFDLHSGSVPTKKLHLSALRGLFDVLVQRHVIILNPAASVRLERYSNTEGKTPDISIEDSRKLLHSIRLDSAIDYRDRAIISMLVFTAARVGAIAKLRLGDLADEGGHLTIRFNEKGGKQRSIPARIDLHEILEAYLSTLPFNSRDKASPVFRSVNGTTGLLTRKPLSPIDICRMLKRRLNSAVLSASLSPHSFRSGVSTALLEQGVSLEDVQYLLGHADPKTTKLYDRRQRKVSRNIVERIPV